MHMNVTCSPYKYAHVEQTHICEGGFDFFEDSKDGVQDQWQREGEIEKEKQADRHTEKHRETDIAREQVVYVLFCFIYSNKWKKSLNSKKVFILCERYLLLNNRKQFSSWYHDRKDARFTLSVNDLMVWCLKEWGAWWRVCELGRKEPGPWQLYPDHQNEGLF